MVLGLINKLNMKALKFFLSFLLLIVFVSCGKKCYRDLKDEEISRLGYKGGESIIFSRSAGQRETISFSQIQKSILPKDSNCKNDKYSLSVGGYFKSKLYSQLYSVNLSIGVTTPAYKDKELVYPRISTSFGYFTISKSTPLTSINIIGKQLYNVYELSNGSHDPNFDVDKIYFSFEYGLIKIVLHDGTYWERINF